MKTPPVIDIDILAVWSVDVAPNDCLYWYSSQSPFTIYLTPFWDGEDGLHVQVDGPAGMTAIHCEVIDAPTLDRNYWLGEGDPVSPTQWGLYQNLCRDHFARLLAEGTKALKDRLNVRFTV